MPARKQMARWIAARRAAEAGERDELREEPLDPRRAFAQAIALIEFAAKRHGWPLTQGPEGEAEGLAFHAPWARLRERARSG